MTWDEIVKRRAEMDAKIEAATQVRDAALAEFQKAAKEWNESNAILTRAEMELEIADNENEEA